jgi:hypothetical protein
VKPTEILGGWKPDSRLGDGTSSISARSRGCEGRFAGRDVRLELPRRNERWNARFRCFCLSGLPIGFQNGLQFKVRYMDRPEAPDTGRLPRKQVEARRIARRKYPFRGCVICGIELDAILQVAHLNNDPSDNDPDNLAWFCATHHWMVDHGLYPVEAIKMLRAHWQITMGQPDHAAVMKHAGPKP